MLDGVSVSKRDRSGVIVREAGPCCGRIAAMEFKLFEEVWVVGDGEDHANDGVDTRGIGTFRWA